MLIPKFIPMPIEALKQGYWLVEACIIGYLDFYQKRNKDFSATNEELAELLHTSVATIKRALKNLTSDWIIEFEKSYKEWGWILRKIALGQNEPFQRVKLNLSKGSNWAFHNIIQEEYNNIYSNYYWKWKWIDEKKCNKLIEDKLKQWITLEDIQKSLTLYNCECRIKQDYQYVKKLETWLKEFQPLTDEQIEETLYTVVKEYSKKKKSDDKFANSKPAKTLWNDLKETFGEEKVKSMFKQSNSSSIHLTFK